MPERRAGSPDRRARTDDRRGQADDRGCIAGTFGRCISVAICRGQTSRVASCLTVSVTSRESRSGSEPGRCTELSEAQCPGDADRRPEGLNR